MKPPRILITRPRPDAEPLADSLHQYGFETLIEPILDIDYIPGPAFDLDGVQALLMTSANGVRAFATRDTHRHHRVFAVGEATAKTATDAGFDSVEAAGGDVESLATLVNARLDPTQGGVFHPAGSAVAGDLGGILSRDGFDYRRDVCYHAKVAERLSPTAANEIQANRIDAVLLFSPRTAKAFCQCAIEAGCADSLRHVTAYCLSDAVAKAVNSVVWKEIVTSLRPDQAILVSLLVKEYG
jgi:uroporphyrinogen-III synthase